jgi:hypothetical protein
MAEIKISKARAQEIAYWQKTVKENASFLLEKYGDKRWATDKARTFNLISDFLEEVLEAADEGEETHDEGDPF